MKINITFNNDDYINLMLQRTGALIKGNHGHLLKNWEENGSKDGFEELINDKEFMNYFLNDIFKGAIGDANGIIDCLINHNNKCQEIASIGCGNCVVELFIARSLKPKIIYLIDIEATPGKHHHGVSNTGAGYNSLESAARFLSTNLEYNPVIVQINPSKQRLPYVRLEACISLYSAGFHYPMEEYREFLENSLTKKAILIFDERLNAPKNFKFAKRNQFAPLPSISTGKSCERQVLTKL